MGHWGLKVLHPAPSATQVSAIAQACGLAQAPFLQGAGQLAGSGVVHCSWLLKLMAIASSEGDNSAC